MSQGLNKADKRQSDTWITTSQPLSPFYLLNNLGLGYLITTQLILSLGVNAAPTPTCGFLGCCCSCSGAFYYTGGVCASCHYSCATCNGGANNNCQSCTASNKRTLSGSRCNCNAGFYDDGVNQLCGTCSYTCATCSGTATTCTTCNTAPANNRATTVTSNSCPCNSGYYDSGSLSCTICMTQCATCTTGTTCATCPSTRTINSANQLCPCNSGFYENGAKTCPGCSYTCVTCQTSATTCLTCSAANQRTKSGSSCPCNSGYYDSGVALCSACNYKCTTCVTSATNCQSCNGANHRTISGSNCPCDTGYYDDGTNNACVSCNYKCSACTTGSVCTACATSSFRTGSTTCPCQSGYYDNNVAICAKCSYTCATCVTSASNCQTCPTSSQRTISSNTCPCNVGFYDDGSSTVCKTCQYQCSTCTSGTSCTGCVASSKRTYSGSNTNCNCDDGYYDQGSSNPICGTCSYQCTTCVTSASNCQSCNPTNHRTLSSNSCPCDPGYYDDGSNNLCKACSFRCLTCTSTSTTCETCDNTKHRTFVFSTKTCDCDVGFYDDGSNSMCATCSAPCSECVTTSTKCTACQPSFRTLSTSSSTCPCDPGFYDTPALVCQQCDYHCATCITSSTNCQSCADANAALSFGSCPCNNGYYDNSTTKKCEKCHYTCATCSQFQICTACLSSAQRKFNNVSSSCPCDVRYYDDGSSTTCQSCDFSCLTCSDSANTSCLSCSATDKRQKNVNTCVCRPGFYEIGVQACSPCNTDCATCVTSSQNCQSCLASQFRELSSNTCQCQLKYYDDGNSSKICAKCAYTCLTCQDETTDGCLSCDSTLNRFLLNKQCSCQLNYFDNGVAKCKSCHYSCETCNGSLKTNCLNCSVDSYRNLTSGQCLCPQIGYFENQNTPVCSPCDSSCYSCDGASNSSCLSCDIKRVGIILQSKQCVCAQGYFMDPSGECAGCDVSCLTCNGLTSQNCTSCDTSPNARFSLFKGTCICPQGTYPDALVRRCKLCHYSCFNCTSYPICDACNSFQQRFIRDGSCLCGTGYYDDGQSPQCQNCNIKCLTCRGPSEYECTSCESNFSRTLLESQCRCNQGKKDVYGSAQCVDTCPPGQYQVGNTLSCNICNELCLTCDGYSWTDCLTCQQTDGLTPQFLSSNTSIYTVQDQVNIVSDIYYYQCLNGQNVVQSSPTDKNIIITWSLIAPYSKIPIMTYNQSYAGGPTEFVIPPMTCQPEIKYIVKVDYFQPNNQKHYSATQVITYIKTTFEIMLEGGNRTVGQDSSFNESLLIFELDKSFLPLKNIDIYLLEWNCTCLVDGSSCKKQDNLTEIVLNNSQLQQYFPEKTFASFNTYLFDVLVLKENGEQKRTAASVYIVPQKIQSLSLQFNPILLKPKININQDIIIDYNISQSGNDVFYYSAQIIYDQEYKKTQAYSYKKVQFKIKYLYDNFSERIGSKLTFQGYIVDPLYSFPSISTVELDLNIPPENCILTVNPKSGEEMIDQFLFTVSQCYDRDQPLTYRFGIYYDFQDISKDIGIDMTNNLIFFNDFTNSPQYRTKLTSTINDNKHDKQIITIIAFIRDGLGGQSNVTQNITLITKNVQDLNGRKMAEEIINLKSPQQKLQLLLLYSIRLSLIQSISTITLAKKIMLSQVLTLEGSSTSLFYQTQIQTMKLLLLTASDMNSQLTDAQVKQYLDIMGEKLPSLLNQQNDTVYKGYQYGMSPELQEQKDGNLGLTIKYAKILSLISNWNRSTLAFQRPIDQIFIKMVEIIPPILLVGLVPDQNKYVFNTTSFNMTVSFVDTLGLNYYTKTQLFQKSILPVRRLLANTSAHKSSKSDSLNDRLFSMSLISFFLNPYRSQKIFPYPEQNSSMVQVEIKEQSQDFFDVKQYSSQDNCKIQTSLSLDFSINNYTQPVCISQTSSNWTNQVCSTTSNKDQIICDCKELGSFTVVDDIDEKYIKKPQENNVFKWWITPMFYLQCSIVSGLLILGYYGYQLDKRDMQSVFPLSTKSDLTQFSKDFESKLETNKHQTRDQQRVNKKAILKANSLEDFQSFASVLSFPGASKPQMEIDTDAMSQDHNQRINTKPKVVQVRNVKYFRQYLLVNHHITNVIMEYDKKMSRPLRTAILFIGSLISLAATFNFSFKPTLSQVLLIAVLSPLVSIGYTLSIEKCYYSNKVGWRRFATLFILASAGALWYGVFNVAIPTTSYELTDNWAILYSISLLADNIFFQTLIVIVKYDVSRRVVHGSDSLALKIARAIFLK